MNKKNLLCLLLLFITIVNVKNVNAQYVQPDWSKNAVVYEVNLRQYSADGGLGKFIDELPRLQNLGIDVLWFMPLHPIGVANRKGSLGSYYSVKDYFAISEEFGTEEEFKRLVEKAHALKMKVIIDWVANHSSWDNQWLTDHPDWYVKNKEGEIVTQYDWTDVAKLDYSNREMKNEMIKAMQHWVKVYDIDGFRCDVAFLVPLDFWVEARTELEKIKPVYMLAEMEWNADITATPDAYFNTAFNASYGWNFMGVTSDYVNGKKTLEQLKSELKLNYSKFPSQMHKLYFLTNHDENSWNGTVDEKYGNNWQQVGVMVYTLPQALPLIYTGEEVALNRRLSFFDKDPITSTEWTNDSRTQWYQNITNLRKTIPAFASNSGDVTLNDIKVNMIEGDANSVLVYKREAIKSEAYVLINFSDKSSTFNLNKFKVSKFKKYKSSSNAKQTLNKKSIVMAPNSYIIYYK